MAVLLLNGSFTKAVAITGLIQIALKAQLDVVQWSVIQITFD